MYIHTVWNYLVKSILVSVNMAKQFRAAVILPQIMRTFVPPQFTSCSGSIKNTLAVERFPLNVLQGWGVSTEDSVCSEGY